MAKEKQVTEEQLLKALGNLEAHAQDEVDEEVDEVVKAADESEDSESGEESDEESMDKAHTEASPGMPGNTKEANGGFKAQKGASSDAENFETNADEEDPTGASMKSLVTDNDTLRKGFEVSAFLEALTDATTESVDSLRKSQGEFQNEQREFNARMQKAIIAMGNMMLDMKKSQTDSGEEPVVVRPRSIVQKSQVVERFEEQNGGEAPKYDRSQTLDALTELAVKGEIPSLVVSAYESNGFVEPTYHGPVNAKLKTMFG